MISPAKYYKHEIETFIKRLVSKEKKNGYYIFDHSLSFTNDIQNELEKLHKKTNEDDRVLVLSFNYLWKTLLELASLIGLRKKDTTEPNWLDKKDIANIFYLAGFEEIKNGNRLLIPTDLGIISTIINKYISQLPLINNLCLTSYQLFRKVLLKKTHKHSVSIVIPARNEEGNITGILHKIPKMAQKMEVIFVEGHSKDNTLKAIIKEIKSNKTKIKTRFFKQKGEGKADAVRLGLKNAKNELLIIFDADLSVNPNDLSKFYNAITSGKTEFANGSRLIYPMQGQAMRTLNYIGNKLFSLIFSYLLNQNIKDTLCGTKAILRKDYQDIEKYRRYFGNFDPFGDYDLLFGASRLNLKINDIPVRYYERKYGTTNISRFRHGLLLLKMTLVAAKKLKFI